MSRAEPDVPSIRTPIAHEAALTTELNRTNIAPEPDVPATNANRVWPGRELDAPTLADRTQERLHSAGWEL